MHYDPPSSNRVCTDTILSLKSSQDCQSHPWDSGHGLAGHLDQRYGGFLQGTMDGLEREILLWMIWGYIHFRKLPYGPVYI